MDMRCLGICLLLLLGASIAYGDSLTACYGPLDCDFYEISCGGDEIIKLNKLQAGRKNQTECTQLQLGQHCDPIHACCEYSSEDEIEEFIRPNIYTTYRNCSGLSACRSQAPWQKMSSSSPQDIITSTYVRLDYTCEQRSTKLNFCGIDNTTAETASGNVVEVLFDGSKENFDPYRASKECECTIRRTGFVAQIVTPTIIDMRLANHGAVECSSATLTFPNFDPRRCVDSDNHHDDNFLYNSQQDVFSVPSRGRRVNLKDIHLGNDPSDAPSIVWMSFSASQPISVSCREVIPAELTTTTTPRPTTTTTTTTTPRPTTTTTTPRPTTTTTTTTTTTPRPTTTTTTTTTTTPRPTTTTTTTTTTTPRPTTTTTTPTTPRPTTTPTTPRPTTTTTTTTTPTTPKPTTTTTTQTTPRPTTTTTTTTTPTTPTTHRPTTTTTTTTTPRPTTTPTTPKPTTTPKRTTTPTPTTTTTTPTSTTTPKPITTPKPTTTPTPTTTTTTPKTTTTPRPTTTPTPTATPRPTTTPTPGVTGRLGDGVDDDYQHAQVIMAIVIPIAVFAIIVVVFFIWVMYTKGGPRSKQVKLVHRPRDEKGLTFYNKFRNDAVLDNYISAQQNDVYDVANVDPNSPAVLGDRQSYAPKGHYSTFLSPDANYRL